MFSTTPEIMGHEGLLFLKSKHSNLYGSAKDSLDSKSVGQDRRKVRINHMPTQAYVITTLNGQE